MERISKNEFRLTDAEMLVSEIYGLLLDQGHGCEDAIIILRGAKVPPGLRTPTPQLDAVLTPEFTHFLLYGE